jgi:hypothetical protein
MGYCLATYKDKENVCWEAIDFWLCGCATVIADLHHFSRFEANDLTTDVMAGLKTMYTVQCSKATNPAIIKTL